MVYEIARTMEEAYYDILIAGGGQAGRRAAEGARAVAPGATIAILGEEPHLPYDRPPLSKEALLSPEGFAACEVRSLDSYAADRIHLLTGQRVRSIERASKIVVTEGGDRIGYGRLVLATGSRPRPLPVPASAAKDVFVLRTKDDAGRLRPRLKPGASIVVIGGGFIGLEVASAAIACGAYVTILEAGERVLSRVLPAIVTERIERLHRAAGVSIHAEVALKRIWADGSGTWVETRREVIRADTVVVGIGIVPNEELAAETGLAVSDGIIVGCDGSTSDPYIFAAGEVARHPVLGATAPLRLESWQVAQYQAEAAGRSAAGTVTCHAMHPWFWSDQLGHNIQLIGHVDQRGEFIVRAYPNGSATFFAVSGSRLVGAVTIDAGQDISVIRRMLAIETACGADSLADPALPLRTLLSAVAKPAINAP
jgi:NADPH-dependent 2,4-dienoyl-CoA reductase/sulfur reductase-like enzyme